MSKKKKKFLIVGIVVILLILILIIAVKTIGNAAKNAISNLETGISVQELSMQNLSSVIYANGTVESQNKVSITTELTGQVKELYVRLGDYVEAGTPLLVMDDTEIRKKITELEKQLSEQDILEAKQKEINQRNLSYAKEEQAQILDEAQKAKDNAQAEINQATAILENAQKTYHAYVSSEMPEPDVLMELKTAVEEAQATLNTAKAALTQAENSYNSSVRSTNQTVQAAQDTIDTQGISSNNDNTATTTLAELYSQLEKITITAPQSGIVTVLNISVGSMVSTGDLMVIEDNKNLKLTVSIPETDILKISTGMHAVIKANALEDVEMSGTVTKVINFASTSSNTNMDNSGSTTGGSYSAEITIDGETQLLLGMNAKAEIVLTEKKDALSIAYDSIFTEEEQSYVYLAKEKESSYIVEKVAVEIGEEGDYYTEIISDRLKEGDLIVSYPETVSEGETIQISTEMKAE